MTRRAALAMAGAITIVLLAAAAAIAANLGVLRVATDTGSAGGLDATDLGTTVTTQHPGDPGSVRGDDQRQEPSHDGSPDDRPGIEPGDDHRPDDHQREDEHYQGREDDD